MKRGIAHCLPLKLCSVNCALNVILQIDVIGFNEVVERLQVTGLREFGRHLAEFHFNVRLLCFESLDQPVRRTRYVLAACERDFHLLCLLSAGVSRLENEGLWLLHR